MCLLSGNTEAVRGALHVSPASPLCSKRRQGALPQDAYLLPLATENEPIAALSHMHWVALADFL